MKNNLTTLIELGRCIDKLISMDAAEANGLAVQFKLFETAVNRSNAENPWFTRSNVILAFKGIVKLLEENALRAFYSQYPISSTNDNKKRIGLVMAGNIPMVGFHDLMCILLSGNIAVVKLSSVDKILMNYLFDLMLSIDPGLKQSIVIVDKLSGIDAVIATGSNNSSRYFEYYFGKYPHIIRKNRNAVAVLTGNEAEEDLKLLGYDIFNYFGLGCRNVSKLYVPQGYMFDTFFKSISSFGNELLMHNKYVNNYDYHHALFLLEKVKFLTNNFLIVKEDESIATPVSVLNYEMYDDLNILVQKLIQQADDIQCIISSNELNMPKFKEMHFNFGEAQYPAVNDFADGIDTMKFISEL